MSWRAQQLIHQHEEVLALTRDIEAAARAIADRDAAVAITLQLARLAGILRIHHALEDEILYPALRSSPDPETARRGERLWREVGGVAEAFMHFSGNWKRADTLLAEQHRFRSEAHAMFAMIAHRITIEQREVFPLAERVRNTKRAA